MSSTFIGPKLENNENETEEPKVDNFEEDQGSDLLKEKEKEKNLASITSTIFLHSWQSREIKVKGEWKIQRIY